MRATVFAVLTAALGMGSAAPALADWVPPFKGNDTGGIIAYSLFTSGVDIKALAVNHCANYGKAVKLTGAQPNYGGYISFECVWVHPGYGEPPLHAAY
ncbi:MAG: hypothetical protein HY242_15925 [Afipia sp.]|nr:hypothetical protein [Afipia sp.]